MNIGALRKLLLADQHRELGARFAPFSGWEMPLQYAGIVEEHRAVRERAGIFDVSHMGRLFVVGNDAGKLLRRALTYKVDQLAEGEAHYALLCADDGGILDDVFVYRIDAVRYLVVNNAANVDIGRERIASFVERGDDVELLDRQDRTVMLALQGPGAPGFLARVLGPDALPSLPRRRCTELEFSGYKLFVAHTGYTGEDGFELVTSLEAAAHLLERLVAEGVLPCGLGARDTLRLEAALPLYGNDIDASTNPYEAGLGFSVTLDDGQEFAGRVALAAAKEAGRTRKLACIRTTERGIMRPDCPILHGGKRAGRVSSGGFSPTLNASIGMGYLPVELAKEGTELEVDVRGKSLPAVVVRRPFYRAEPRADDG
ncbi:MAG: glycine cleavage system aminomethyltransferase GcvT [Chloroflexi bacterium]|nr:glycine cleavage system aminomethyltransferase GcvT [Chloroflexota bacterium]